MPRYLETDVNNSGTCGHVCANGLCASGACCSAGLSICGDQWFDLQNDNHHCGSCSQVCPSGLSCTNGNCCPAGETLCGEKCVDLSRDVNNCGVCGRVCPCNGPDEGAICDNGFCCITNNKPCSGCGVLGCCNGDQCGPFNVLGLC